MKVKRPFLLVAEQLFDPHPFLVQPNDRKVCREVCHQPPGLLFSFGPVVDQIDRSKVMVPCDRDLLESVAFSFLRIQRTTLSPQLPVGFLNVGFPVSRSVPQVGICMQTHAVSPFPLPSRLEQVNRMKLPVSNQNGSGLRRRQVG